MRDHRNRALTSRNISMGDHSMSMVLVKTQETNLQVRLMKKILTLSEALSAMKSDRIPLNLDIG